MTMPSYWKHPYRAYALRIQYALALPKVQTFQLAKFYDSKHDNFLNHFQKSYLKIQIHYQKAPTKFRLLQSNRNPIQLRYVTKYFQYPIYQILQ
jgi:hypothetical protein